ncbi:MAG: hypothetical protein H6741_07960 [Alphaproteobacteria bacterium]|nr:hypothetical protein [Alphaproteobacteria bacterium]
MLLLALGLLLSAVGLAAEPQVLLGDWEVDQDASEDIDDILAARGATWLERQAIRNLPITYSFRAKGETIILTMDSPIYSRTVDLIPDNAVRTRTSSRMGAYTVRHFHDEAGALVTVSDMTLPDGVPAVFTVTRSLVDPATMHIHWELNAEDGRQMAATRVLRREAG